MKVYLIAVGNRMPDWVERGVANYARRLTQPVKLEIIEVPAIKRGKNTDLDRVKNEEGRKLLEALPKNSMPVALDSAGKALDTRDLARLMRAWIDDSQDVGFLIGGPEGLSSSCLDACRWRLSLSPMTLAHPLVRVVMAEQLYRAYSICQGLPYHR